MFVANFVAIVKITGFDIYPDDYAERGYSCVDKKTVMTYKSSGAANKERRQNYEYMGRP